jgi:hypothetical protein
MLDCHFFMMAKAGRIKKNAVQLMVQFGPTIANTDQLLVHSDQQSFIKPNHVIYLISPIIISFRCTMESHDQLPEAALLRGAVTVSPLPTHQR